jgi:aldose 1-epimerase
MQARVWDILACSETAVTLGLMLRDGEDGFPGQRVVMARFSLTGAALRLDVQATTDAPTLMNIAQHSYWNLNGTPDWAGHVLQLAATHVLPTNAAGLPTGQIEAVDGTALDFRKARGIAPGNPVMDVNFCVAQTRQPLRDVLWLSGHAVQMTFATTEPGVQVYDGAAGIRPGHGPYEGLAIEAQGWPDAPQHAHFPAITLLPQDRYHQTTVWQFAAL